MQLALGRKGDYSVRAVLDVAGNWTKGRRKARQIAEVMDIPERYITQILANLVREGLLTAVAGPDGGYELARPPESISLRDVVEASEGPLALDKCILRGGSCDWVSKCPVHDTWSRAQAALLHELDSTTFADLAKVDLEMVAGKQPVLDSEPHSGATQRKGKSRA